MAVVLPQSVAPGLRTVEGAQRYVLERLAAGLGARGMAIAVLGSGDLTCQRRKVAGSAQRRLRLYVLVHTTILYDFPLGLISRYLAEPRRQPSYREARRHEDFVANLGCSRAVLREAVLSAWVDPAAVPPRAEVPEQRVRDLVASQFGEPAWIERF